MLQGHCTKVMTHSQLQYKCSIHVRPRRDERLSWPGKGDVTRLVPSNDYTASGSYFVLKVLPMSSSFQLMCRFVLKGD